MSLNDKFIEKWVGYLNDVDRDMCIIAAQKLGASKNKAVVPDLVKALNHRPDDIRTAAARALGVIGDPSAVPALVKLLGDSNSLIASAAADSLGEIGDPSAVPALVKILSDYRSGKSRHTQIHGFDRGLYMAAIYALQKINTPEARRALAQYNR